MARAKADAATEAESETSQADMVRAALQELGAGAKPRAMQEFIKERFGRDVSRGIISNYKSTMKKKGEVPVGVTRRGPGRPARAAGGDAVRLDDLEAVRDLVDRLGPDGVVRLVKVLG